MSDIHFGMASKARPLGKTLAQFEAEMTAALGTQSVLAPTVTELYEVRRRVANIKARQEMMKPIIRSFYDRGIDSMIRQGNDGKLMGRRIIHVEPSAVTKTTVRAEHAKKLAEPEWAASRVFKPYISVSCAGAERPVAVTEARYQTDISVLLDHYYEYGQRADALIKNEEGPLKERMADLVERYEGWDGLAVVTTDGWTISTKKFEFSPEEMKRKFPVKYQELAVTSTTQQAAHCRVVKMGEIDIRNHPWMEEMGL